MKINAIVLFENDKLIRVGVVTKNITVEEMDHTSTRCEVRIAGPKKVETSSLLLTDMTEIQDSNEFRANPALSLISISEDWKSAVQYAGKKAAKPDEDPDHEEIPF